jgi:hypothetical protein
MIERHKNQMGMRHAKAMHHHAYTFGMEYLPHASANALRNHDEMLHDVGEASWA